MTSLSQQLRKLAVPQTSVLVDLKKLPSILFDPKDAALKDRKTIFDLGYQGLKELITLKSSFAQFEETLFQPTTLHVERSIEDSSFNKQLDANIELFLHHLSPYFMSRSAHMCLEWLIRRFQIHEFNKNAFMRLILPYHETNIFVKCVQIMKLKNPSDAWHWLSNIQKSGVPLTKPEIIRRAINDKFLLSFVCASTVEATSATDSNLQCLINFYSTVVIGVLHSCQHIQEWHVSTILPSTIKGMKSSDIDYISSSFMITSVLITKTKPNAKLSNALITQICKVEFEQLQIAKLLLLSLIFKTGQLKEFPHKGLLNFISNKSLLTAIRNIDAEVSMDYIVPPLFYTSFKIIQTNSSEATFYQEFIKHFLDEIELSDSSAKSIVTLVLQSFSFIGGTHSSNGTDIIDLESDNESWVTNIIQSLERQYPSAFDEVVKETMQSGEGALLRNVLCVAFRRNNIDENISSIFQRLYHSNPEIRAASFKDIVSRFNASKINSTEFGILKKALAELLKDDRVEVLQEVLKLPTEVLVDNVGCVLFTESIIDILDKAKLYPNTWGQLQSVALGHLTSEKIVTNYDNNLLLLILMRFLIPTNNDEKWKEYVKIILESYFGKSSNLFHGMDNNFKNMDELKKKCLDHITRPSSTLRADDLVASVQKSGYNFFKTSTNVSHFLIILTAGLKSTNQPEKSMSIYTFTLNQCKQFKILQFSGNQWMSNTNNNAIPLQLLMDFLQCLIETTHFGDLSKWEHTTNSLTLFLEILNLMTSNAFNTHLTGSERQAWAKYLDDILDMFFPSLYYKITVLSNFFLYESLSVIENYSQIRIRALKVLELILKRGGNDLNIDLRFVLKIVIGLSSPQWFIRQCSLNTMLVLQTLIEEKTIENLVRNIIKKSESLLFDSEQISFFFFSNLNTDNRKDVTGGLLEEILNIIKDSSECYVLKSQVLDILKHIRTAKILEVALELTLNLLNNTNENDCVTVFDRTSSAIFESTVVRFDEKCIKDHIENAWALIEKSFEKSNTFITTASGKLRPISCITLEIFDEQTYNQLPSLYKTKLLKLVIRMLSNSNNDVLFLDINRVFRRCTINCEQILPFLDDMKNICSDQANKKGSIEFAAVSQWKEGIVLLEILENKKKVLNSEVLVPKLFDILKKCLEIENQSPLEYTKQLILSNILQSCKCINSQKTLNNFSGSVFRTDIIVQCIRMTQNPETQFKALSLLTYCASLFPQQVLYNSLEIFTFIGSSFARHDDAFSFQVISNVLESIVPILVESKDKSVCFDLVVPVLKVFSDILLDVPEHRRMPLYTKLLHTLGSETYFWIFLCIVFESLTENSDSNKQVESQTNSLVSPSLEKLPRKVEIALNLLHECHINTSLETCIALMTYVKTLPIRKEDVNDNRNEKLQYANLFDIATKSSKQLRHYKYLILQFVSTFTSSSKFLKAACAEDVYDKKTTKDLYKNLMVKILSYLPDLTDAIQKRKDARHMKFWGILLDHCYDALDNIISLLSPDMFLIVVCGLMDHTLLTVRKEVLRLLINKLQERTDYFIKCSDENIVNLLNSLHNLINTILLKDNLDNTNIPLGQTNNNETIMVQQAGLIAIKLLSKLFGIKFLDNFMKIVLVLSNITKECSRVPKIIFATIILTLVEVVSNLKANAISYLPKCIPHLIDALRDQATILQKHSGDNVSLVLLTGIQRLVETMPLFLGPYIVDIVSVLSTIWSLIQNKLNRKQQINNLRSIWSKIAADVPSRILIPSCETAYYKLMKERSFLSVGFVMNLLLECLSKLKHSDLISVQSELTNFFLKALDFRSDINEFNSDQIFPEHVSKIEMEIINAFIAWILKLSESSFRPIYKKMYDWAMGSNVPKGRLLTFFILNDRISDSLKSIFVLFAGDLVLDTAHILDSCNTFKNNGLFVFDDDLLNIELLKNMLSTYTKVFMHGNKGFINSQKFEGLIPSIGDQLENNLVLNSDELQRILLNCIGQMVTAVSTYTLWKSLNYHILLKTRSEKSQIRILSINCCVELARSLGDDFTSLLPETIPFVAELFEDENPQVVKNSRKAVQEIESILGEPLQKYL